ncbi:MAG: DUF4367 domain-containing protein [Oliverpabstia sp.]
MSKSVKIQDSPEFKEFKENFDAMMDAMEKDPEFAKMKIPEEWEQDFKETLEATGEKERQRKKNRIGKRIVIAAGVTLVTLAGLNLGVQQVQGEGLVEFFQRTFNLGGKQYTTFDVGEDMGMNEDSGVVDIFLEGDTLEEVYDSLHDILKRPMFYVTYIPDGYHIELAQYSETYDVLNITLISGENVIHIYQQQQIDEFSYGTANEKENIAVIDNENINQKIIINRSIQDESLSVDIKENQMYLAIRCMTPIEECKKIVESIKYY